MLFQSVLVLHETDIKLKLFLLAKVQCRSEMIFWTEIIPKARLKLHKYKRYVGNFCFSYHVVKTFLNLPKKCTKSNTNKTRN